jgi:hypothetical protein
LQAFTRLLPTPDNSGGFASNEGVPGSNPGAGCVLRDENGPVCDLGGIVGVLVEAERILEV